MLAKMAQNIIQNLSANNGTIFGGNASSTANQSIQNYLKTKISTSFVQNCVASTIANQNIQYGGVQIGVFDSQGVNIFQSCMMNALNNNKVAQGITSDTSQTGNASNTAFSFGSLFSGFGSYIYYILFFILIIIVAYFGLQYISKSKIESPPPTQ